MSLFTLSLLQKTRTINKFGQKHYQKTVSLQLVTRNLQQFQLPNHRIRIVQFILYCTIAHIQKRLVL